MPYDFLVEVRLLRAEKWRSVFSSRKIAFAETGRPGNDAVNISGCQDYRMVD